MRRASAHTNKLNDTVEPALIKLSETMQTLKNTLDHLGPLSTKVDQLESNWKKVSEEMQARVSPIVSADLVGNTALIEQNLSVVTASLTSISELTETSKGTVEWPASAVWPPAPARAQEEAMRLGDRRTQWSRANSSTMFPSSQVTRTTKFRTTGSSRS